MERLRSYRYSLSSAGLSVTILFLSFIAMSTWCRGAPFNSIQTGRYPVNWSGYLVGNGPTVHVTGQTSLNGAPAEFNNSNNGGVTSVTFTVHVDSAYVFNPIGALIHLIRDVLGLGGSPCPQ